MNHRPYAFLSAALLALLAACDGAGKTNEDSPDVYRVTRGDLRITVKESANLKAARETRVKSQVEGQNTVIFLVPEGTVVKKGDKLVEIDASALVERRANQAISVAKAEAALVQAQKNMEILQKELRADRNAAESKLKIAQMELEKFLGREPADGQGRKEDQGTNREMVVKLRQLVSEEIESAPLAATDSETLPQSKVKVEMVDPRTYAPLVDKARELLTNTGLEGDESALDRDMGEMANQVLQQIDAIRLAMADLKVKEDTYGHSLRLRSKDIITQNELDRDELAFQSQASKVTLAWNDLDLLINYTLAKQRIELIQDVRNAQLELERVIASNDARYAREEANLKSTQAEYDLALERLQNLDTQIENAVIYAPTPGLVVYAQVGDGRRNEMVEEGMSVRERQNLIVLPDTTRMQAELKVQEADIDKVAPGQPAVITIDASDEVFYGKVSRVAPLPDSGSRWTNNDRKVYKTWIDIDGHNENQVLRPNMSATVEIVVAVVENTLPVPLQAVRRDRAVTYVWKLQGGKPVATPVQTGRSNATHVELLSGVQEGDLILLAPPAGVEQPEFEQPEVEDILPAAAAAAANTGDSGVPTPAVADGRETDGAGEAAPAFDRNAMRRVGEELRAYLIEKFPDRQAEIEDRRGFRQLLQDPDIQAALEERPELYQRYQSMVEAMMQQFRNGGMRGGMPGRRGEGGGPGREGSRRRNG